MRHQLVLLFFLCSACIWAQDVIVKKDGKSIIAKVMEINPDLVKYKKYSNLDGPIYSVEIANLVSINYENGEIERFDNTVFEEKHNSHNLTGEIKMEPDGRNEVIIEETNRGPECTDPKIDKHKKLDAIIVEAFMGIDRTSHVSNKDVEMKFECQWIENSYWCHVVIKNKTNKIIYIDKASTFLIDKNNNGTPLYKGSIISSSSGASSGAGIGLGAISSILGISGTVGQLLNSISLNQGSSSSTTTAHIEQQILAIPPYGEEVLFHGEMCYVPVFYIPRGSIHMTDIVEYNYEESPVKWSYFVTYSDDQNFRHYSNLYAKSYCRYLYGSCGQPIRGGNLVEAGNKYFKTTFISRFRLKKDITERTKILPNVISSK